jgi:hypothetical protein
MPSTEGVAYTLTEGDGRSGPWSVRARAREGFVLAEGAPTRFSGDLGPFVACPSFADVSAANTSGTVWSVSANVDAFDAASYTIGVELRFDTTVFTGGFTGAGWACSATDGTTPMPLDGTEYQLEPGVQWIVCEFQYDGADPGAVAVTVDAGVPGDLNGTATLVRDGMAKGSRPF